MTPRAARSPSNPATGRPARAPSWTAWIAASRASRTVRQTFSTSSGTRVPENPIQVWSAKTVVVLPRPPHRSSRMTWSLASVASFPASGS